MMFNFIHRDYGDGLRFVIGSEFRTRRAQVLHVFFCGVVGFSSGLATASLFFDQSFSLTTLTTLVLFLDLNSPPTFEFQLTTLIFLLYTFFPVCIDWLQMLSGAPPSPLVVMVGSCLSLAHDLHCHVFATVKAPTFS
jgi:hypothetical protein